MGNNTYFINWITHYKHSGGSILKTTLFAQETPLHKVFSDDYLFTIPSVQRPYSWTTNEAGELLDDLLDFIEHYGITEKILAM